MEFSPRLPFQAKLFYRRKKHTIELGIALTPYTYYYTEESFSENIKNTQFAFLGQMGYQHSVFKDNFFVGIAFTPLISDDGDLDFYPWGALRFGYKF